MKALSFALLMLALLVLGQGAAADEYGDHTDVGIDEGDHWVTDVIEIPANATFSIDIVMTDPESINERNNFTGMDIYLLTEDEYDDYENEEEFDVGEWGPWENRSGIQWSKPLETEIVSLMIVIDNWNNTRDSDAIPNGSVDVDINYSVVEREEVDLDPPGDDEGSEGDITTFIILAIIVLVVLSGIGMAVRGRGGSEGDEGGGEEEEDYFGRVRIG